MFWIVFFITDEHAEKRYKRQIREMSLKLVNLIDYSVDFIMHYFSFMLMKVKNIILHLLKEHAIEYEKNGYFINKKISNCLKTFHILQLKIRF